MPKKFEERFPVLQLLVKAVIEGINPKGVHYLSIKDQARLDLVGSVISPMSPQRLSMDGKTVKFTGLAIAKDLPLNTISFMPTPVKSAKVKLGDEEFECAGGRVGIIIDLRLGGFA